MEKRGSELQPSICKMSLGRIKFWKKEKKKRKKRWRNQWRGMKSKKKKYELKNTNSISGYNWYLLTLNF